MTAEATIELDAAAGSFENGSSSVFHPATTCSAAKAIETKPQATTAMSQVALPYGRILSLNSRDGSIMNLHHYWDLERGCKFGIPCALIMIFERAISPSD